MLDGTPEDPRAPSPRGPTPSPRTPELRDAPGRFPSRGSAGLWGRLLPALAAPVPGALRALRRLLAAAPARPRPRPAASLLLAAAGFLSPGFRAAPSHPPPERDGAACGRGKEGERRREGGGADAPRLPAAAAAAAAADARRPAAAQELGA